MSAASQPAKLAGKQAMCCFIAWGTCIMSQSTQLSESEVHPAATDSVQASLAAICLPAFKPLGRPAQPLGLSVWGPMPELAMAALEGVK